MKINDGINECLELLQTVTNGWYLCELYFALLCDDTALNFNASAWQTMKRKQKHN